MRTNIFNCFILGKQFTVKDEINARFVSELEYVSPINLPGEISIESYYN